MVFNHSLAGAARHSLRNINYFLAGLTWFLILHKRSPEAAQEIERDIEETHGRFAAPIEEALAVS